MKNRNINLDITRTIAILCVVFCHSVESIYKFNLSFTRGLSTISKSFMFISFTIDRLGVPLFLFLFGFLLLVTNKRNNINERISRYFTRVSKISLSIFFIHVIVLYFVKPLIISLNIMSPLKVIGLFLITFIISTIISLITSKFKVISKYALVIK